jgi:hypothetical protein
MSEQVPKITQEDIVYAWNAAQAANEAFDGVQEAGTSIDMLGVFEQAGVQFVNIQETREAFDTDYDNAVANHRFQVAKAAPVMLLPRSPFAQNKPTPEAEPAPDLKESILEQLLPAHDAYVTVTDQLNRGRCNNIERIELVNITTAETELHGFLSQEKMRYLTAATEADPELRFTLVATPNVLVVAEEIIALAEKFGEDQPYKSAIWPDIYKKYDPAQLSGFDAKKASDIKFVLIPNKFQEDMSGTAIEQRQQLAELRADTSILRVPTVIEDIAFWHTLRAQGDSLTEGDVFGRTYIHHFDLEPQRIGGYSYVPGSCVNGGGKPGLGSSNVDDRGDARVAVG